MEKVEYHNKQQLLLEKFYKEFLSWRAENIGMWIAAGFFLLLYSAGMLVPYQDVKAGDHAILISSIYSGIMGVYFYMLPYLQYKQDNKMHRIYEKIQYLPISLKEIRIFRINKLVKFCLKLFPVYCILQILSSWLSYHEIGWGNIFHVVVFGLFLPIIVVGVIIMHK